MSKPTIHRIGLVDLAVRGAGDGRTITGLAVPFDEPTRVDDGHGPYTEVFRRGAFAKTISDGGPSRVKLHGMHDAGQRFPIGKTISLREDAAGLIGEWRISETERGNEALTLIADGTLDGLSIGFAGIRNRTSDDRETVERLEVALREVSIVPVPAYARARVHSLRSLAFDEGNYISAADARARLAAALERNFYT